MLVLYNTLTRKKEKFTPLKKGVVAFYLCGPTVYNVGHLGHARSAVAFDLIRKYLEYKGYKVIFVSNYTDVDDKMIDCAKLRGIKVHELAEEVIPKYQRDYGLLGVKKPIKSPRATEFIKEMIVLIEKLVAKGYAYTGNDGIYFEVRKFRNYGKLSGQKLEDLIKGARVELNETKKNPEDFALWKKIKDPKFEPSWDGPLRMRGRPGWHIECSAMSASLLGETIDIHAGGQDLIFPHHEDEIAQSEAATGKKFVKYWLHNGFIKINEEKMSKSLGNFFTIEDVLKVYHPKITRYFLLSTHYRMPIDYSPDLLEQAKASISRLQDFYRALLRLKKQFSKKRVRTGIKKKIFLMRKNFEASMDDDFEISKTLASIFDFLHDINVLISQNELLPQEASYILNVLDELDAILGVIKPEDMIDEEIKKFIKMRDEARKKSDYKGADEIRESLKRKGVILEDTKEGTIWKRSL